MHVFQWSLLLILVFVLPNLIGTIVSSNMDKTEQTPAMNYLCGWFLCFAVFEVITVPFILLQSRFLYVAILYTCVMLFLATYSVCRNRSVFRKLLLNHRNGWNRIGTMTKLAWLVFGLILIGQILASIFLDYYDGDDPFFLPIAGMACDMDVMYTRDAYTGYVISLDMRHALAPTPLFYAWLSKLTGVHVAIVAHVVLAPAFLLLMYAVYTQLAKRLFAKQIDARPYFMILIALWYMFGNISLYTAETFAMNRTWQGKAILGNIVLPALFWCFLKILDGHAQRGVWILLVLVSISAFLCSSIAFMFLPTLFGIMFLLWLRGKGGKSEK